MRIKVGDIILDAFRDEVIAQNYAVNQLGDIVTRQGSYSNDFEIPLTAKNRDALGFPSDINSNSRKPYQKVQATLIDQGTPIAEGYLKYQATSNNTLRCSFFATNVEWFALIKNKKLSDINLSEFDHDWTIENIKAAIEADKDSGYTYPLIDYGEFNNSTPTASEIRVDGDQMYPAMFVHTIIEKMFFDVGWKVEGEMIDHPLYRRMIIPFSAESFNQSESFIEDNTEVFTLPSGDQEQSFSFVFDDTWDYDIVWDSDTEIDITTAANYEISVILNLDLSYIKDPTTTVNQNTFIPISILINGVVEDQMDSVSVPFSGNSASISGQYTRSFITTLQPGDTVEVRVSGDIDLQVVGDVDLDLTVLELNTSVTIAPSSQEIAYGATITMANILPDITQEDFLKYLVFIFGAVPQANNLSKTINFSFFRSIKNNIPDALDWSNKIDMSKTRELDFTELLQNYSQVSIMTYMEDENDRELRAYEAETGRRFGEGRFDIQNEHLSSRGTIYEAPFSPMININSFDNTFYIPQIRFKAILDAMGEEEQPEVEPVPKIAILSKNMSISTLSGGLFENLAIINPNDLSGVAVNVLPFCWFAKTSLVNEVNSLFDSLVFDQISFPNVIGEPLIDRFLIDYKDILNSVKYQKAYFKLSEIDIASLDFTVPIFVDKLKSYFYISKINNYQGSGTTVECEIVKISKSVEDLPALTPENVFIDNDLVVFIDNDGESFFDGP